MRWKPLLVEKKNRKDDDPYRLQVFVGRNHGSPSGKSAFSARCYFLSSLLIFFFFFVFFFFFWSPLFFFKPSDGASLPCDTLMLHSVDRGPRTPVSKGNNGDAIGIAP